MNLLRSFITGLALLGISIPGQCAESNAVRVLIWDEQQPEQRRAYDGKHLGETIAAHLAQQPGFTVKIVTLASPEQGLATSDLEAADVLIWWGHQRHRDVKAERVEEVVNRVKTGRLGLIALHSAHWSQPFVRLMEERALADVQAKLPADAFVKLQNKRPAPYVAPKRQDPVTPSLARDAEGHWLLTLPGCCFPAYRADGAPSHVTTLLPSHPIATGLPGTWDIPQTEMYDEPFHVPPPDAVVFEERWDKGERFRSGSVWKVGQGQVVYFRPGHETFPVYRQVENLRVVENAARWLASNRRTDGAKPAPKKSSSLPPSKLVLPGENFLVQGRPAFLFLPPEAKRTHPQPWIFYAPTLPAYPDEAERWMHEQFLAAGIAVAGVDAGEAYGSPKSHALFDALYAELTGQRGFGKQPCLFGRSRGGLWVSSWAIAHPERVSGIIGIYPVFDFRTYPGVTNAAPAYELTPAQLAARAAEFNPIERIDVLARAKIPVALIHGDLDKVVPLRENSAELVRRYSETGASSLVNLIILQGQGHNFFEGFFHSQPLVDFAIDHARSGARP